MPMRLNVGASRKVGEANYGSRDASISIELEFDADLILEPARLQGRVRQLFALARAALGDELNGNRGHNVPMPSAGRSSDYKWGWCPQWREPAAGDACADPCDPGLGTPARSRPGYALG